MLRKLRREKFSDKRMGWTNMQANHSENQMSHFSLRVSDDHWMARTCKDTDGGSTLGR